MTLTINEAEARLRLALAAKADAVTVADAESATAPEAVFDAEVIRLRANPGPVRPSRRRWAAIAVAAAVALVVGSAVAITVHGRSTGSAPATPNPHDIPWSQVGPSWALIVTHPASDDAATAVHTLLLASPTGVNYPITHRAGEFVIAEGTWNHQTEQVLTTTPTGPLLIDLRTGHQTGLAITGLASGGVAALGRNFLIQQGNRLSVLDDTGRVLRRFEGSATGGFLASPDGRQVAVGAATGLVVYDASSGKVTQRWSAVPGTTGCNPQTWLTSESLIEGVCGLKQRSGVNLRATFSLNTGATTASTLPGGWATIQITDGTVAYRVAGDATAPAAVPLGKTVEFARADSTGALTPLPKPVQFDQGTWLVYYVLAQGLLVLENDTSYEKVAVWNPLSGKVTTYFAHPAGGDIVTGFDVWS